MLWEIAAEVYIVERLGQFADKAAATLADLAGSGVPKAQLKIGGRLQELVRVTLVSENNYRSEGTADLRSVPFDREGGWATAKEGEAHALARRALRPVSPEEEMLVQNLADAAESFPSIEGLTCP